MTAVHHHRHRCWLVLLLLLLTRSNLLFVVFCYPLPYWLSSSSWAKNNRRRPAFAVIMPPLPRDDVTTATPTLAAAAAAAAATAAAPNVGTTTAPPITTIPATNGAQWKPQNGASPAVVVGDVYEDNNNIVHHVNGVDIKIGPDLNASKPPLDSKLYRQILLPNGMRCVLIQDMTAMRQQQVDLVNSDDDEDDDDEKEEEGQEKKDEKDDEGDDDDDDNDTGLRDAAAALVVGAGSAYDPLSCQGMAHFLEHLLFMGSEKYPVENEYEAYVAKHGGSDNAYTEWEYTCYSMHIPQEFLWGGLDRLAQHFVAPLLLESAVDRELQAIESEYQTNACTSDECRREQLLCATSRLDEDNNNNSDDAKDHHDHGRHRHYLTKFAWGNLHSLRTIPKILNVDPLKELRRFFNQYYYGANMRLVVMGAYPLDYMQGKIVDIFAAIPALPRPTTIDNDSDDKDINEKATSSSSSPYFDLPVRPEEIFSWNAKYKSPLAQYGSPLDAKRSLAKIFRIVPIKERHAMTLSWPLLPSCSSPYVDWRSKPTDYIAHLIGHEASGSLLSLLRKHDYATDLHAGVGDEGGVECASSHALFTLTVVLSTHGLEHWRQVVNFVYQYIGMLRFYSSSSNSSSDNSSWPEWIYQEQRQMQNMSYRFGDEASPDDTVEALAESLAPHVQLPPDRLLDGQALLWEFDAAKVKSILDECLTPANARIDLQSSMFAKHVVVKDHNNNNNSAPSTETVIRDLIIMSEREDQDIFLDSSMEASIPPPQVEPMFGTHFWCSNVPPSWIEEWNLLSQPTKPSDPGVGLHLPQPNPFVPENYDIKKLPENDAHHVLLNSSLKLCIPVGKTKQWFAATVLQYNRRTNALLLSFEDEDEKWHVLDDDPNKNETSNNSCSIIKALSSGGIDSYEGTMDGKKTKFRIVSLGGVGSSAAVRKFGDASDEDVLDGTKFPPIPPALLPSRRPKEILGGNNNRLRLWHLQDRSFHRPIAELRLEIVLASDVGGGGGGDGGGDQAPVSPSTSPLARACAELMVELVMDTCLETAYLASICELESAMMATCVGWNLRFHGFGDKLLRLVELYLNVIGSFRHTNDGEEQTLPKGVEESRFHACLEVLRRNYRNSGIKASSLASSARVWALRPTLWSDHAKLTAIKDLTIATFMQTIVSMFESSSLTIEALYHGNVDENDAHKAIDLISSSSIMTPTEKTTSKAEAETTTTKANGGKKKKGQSKKKEIANIPPRSILKIPSVMDPSVILLPSREPERVNDAVEVYIQVGKDNVEERIMIDFLVHMMDEPLFDQVRTKEQYGYSVYCDARWSYGIMGFVFGIVSNVKSADQIVERVDQFLRDFRQQLVDMSQEDYLEHQAGLAMQKLDAFDSLSDETDSYWNEITEGRYEWQAWRDEAICLRGITKEQALAAFDAWLRPDQKRRILAVKVVGDSAAAAEGGKSSETVAGGREEEQVGQVVSDQIAAFHKLCKNQTWGRVNSKLF